MEQNYSNEELENIIENGRGVLFGSASVVLMAQDLLTERKKPKVWDGIDSKRNYAIVYTCETDTGIYTSNGKKYTRSLPKSPEREIAEKWADKYLSDDTRNIVDDVESAINEFKALKA